MSVCRQALKLRCIIELLTFRSLLFVSLAPPTLGIMRAGELHHFWALLQAYRTCCLKLRVSSSIKPRYLMFFCGIICVPFSVSTISLVLIFFVRSTALVFVGGYIQSFTFQILHYVFHFEGSVGLLN